MSINIKTIETKVGIFRADYYEDLEKDVKKRLDAQKKKRTTYSFKERCDDVLADMQRRYKFDSAGVNLMERSLIHVLSGIREVLYPGGNIVDRLVSVNTEGGAGLAAINQQTIDMKGELKEINGQADDIPEVAVVTDETGRSVGVFGGSYGFSQVDLERAAKGQVPLNQNLAKTAARAVMKTKNRIFLYGSKSTKGLFSHKLNNMSDKLIIDWSDEDVTNQDILDVCYALIGASGRVDEDFESDVLAVDPDIYHFLTTNFRGTGTDATLAELILSKTGVGGIVKTSYLRSVKSPAGGDGFNNNRVMLAMPRDSMIMEFMLPRNAQTFPMEKRGMQYVTDILMDSAGTFVHHPEMVAVTKITALPESAE